MKKYIRSQPTFLTEYTTQREFNATWTAVTAAACANIFKTFVSWKVQSGTFLKVGFKPWLRLKLYTAGGVELTAGDLYLVVRKPARELVIPICSICNYSNYAAISWVEQGSQDYREAITFDTGYEQIILLENEQLEIQCKGTDDDIPAACHGDTHLQMPILCVEAVEAVRTVLTQSPPGVDTGK